MASQAQTVSLYHRKLREIQSISHSLHGHFTSDSAQEFILVKGPILELIGLDSTTQSFKTICQHDTSSTIRAIKVLTFGDHGRDYIAVATDTGIMTVLRYNKTISSFEPVISEMYGRSGIRRTVAGQYIACDPLGRSIMVAGLEYSKVVYGVSTELQQNLSNIHAPATRVFNTTSGVELTASNTVTYDLAALHTERYANPCFVSIESNYNEVASTNIVNKKDPNSLQNTVAVNLINSVGKYNPQNRCKYLVVYEHEVNLGHLNKLTKIATVPIPSTAHKIIPIPISHIYPGGCIVLCENACYYYPIISPQQLHSLSHQNEAMMSINSHPGSSFHETLTLLNGIRCDYPIRITQQSKQPHNTMINTSTSFLLQTKKTHKLFLFIQTEFGDIFKINLSTVLQRNEHKTIVKNIQQQIQHAQQQAIEARHNTNATSGPSSTTSMSVGHFNISSELQTIGITNSVTEMSCEYFDTIPPANGIHLTNKGHFFASAENTDSALFKMKSPEIDRTDPSYAVSTSLIYHTAPAETSDLQEIGLITQQQIESSNYYGKMLNDSRHPTDIATILQTTHQDIIAQMSFLPTPLLRLQYQANIPTFSVLRSAAISSSGGSNKFTQPNNNNLGSVSADTTNTLSIYTSHGALSRSYLAVNKFGLLYNVLANSSLKNTPTSLFRAITNCFFPKHTLVCMSFPKATMVMSTNGTLQDFTHENLTLDQTTIAFGNVIDSTNSNSQPNITLISNIENQIYLNNSAIIQITPKQVNCLTNGNTGPIDQSTDESTEQSLQYISNGYAKWTPGIHDITCADLTYNYIIIGSSSKLYVLKLSFGTITEVCSLDCFSVISHITAYKEPFEQTIQQGASGSLFFSTVGVDGFLRFYTLVHEHGVSSLNETDSQHINTPNPSSILITTTNVETTGGGGGGGGATSGSAISNTANKNFYYSCHLIVKDMLYQFTISPEGQILVPEPTKQYIGGNSYSYMKLCLIENAATENSSQNSSDIVLCSTNRTPQVFHNNNWLQLNIFNPSSPVTDDDETGHISDIINLQHSKQLDPNFTNPKPKGKNIKNLAATQQYSALYNAIYLDSPIGQLIFANCDSELLICQSAPAGAAAVSLNPSRFIRPDDLADETISTYFDSNRNYLTTTATQPLTYTCRNLVHLDVKDLCAQYRITHTPLSTTIVAAPHGDGELQSTAPAIATAMGDTPTGDEDSSSGSSSSSSSNSNSSSNSLPYQAPADIIDTGVCKLSKQMGSVLITVEGDNQITSAKENNTLYQTTLEQQYKSLVHSGVDFDQDYTIKHPLDSNTAQFTGGNTLEYFTGYTLGTEYNGCVRLSDPHSLQTYHAISTPQNMIITCSTLAVMNDYTVFVVGGYRSRPLEHDINLKTGQNIHFADTAPGQAQVCVTTGLLVTYELYYSTTSQSWALSHLHTTHTPHRVSAINKVHYNQSLLVGQSDELCVYELGKRQLLFKSKIALRRGLITTITPTAQYNVLDHTNAINTMVYVGFAGQGHSMIRLSINKPMPINSLGSTSVLAQVPTTSTRYIWNLLCNNVDSRYSLSVVPVQGGFVSGDRFGNLTLYGLSNEDVVTLLKDPTGYAPGRTVAPNLSEIIANPTSTTFGNYYYNELGVRLQNFAEIYLTSPITNIFTVNLPNYSPTATPSNTGQSTPQTQQCVLYTTLSGQIGILKPISSPFENEILQKCILYCYNQLTITGTIIRKYLSTWNPVLNIIDGNILFKWLTRLRSIHYTIASSSSDMEKAHGSNTQLQNVYNYNPNYSADQHYQHLLAIANDYCGGGATFNPNVLLELLNLIQLIDNNALR